MKMKSRAVLMVIVALAAGLVAGQKAEASHSIGVGTRYWRPVDELDSSYDQDLFSYLLTYQYNSSVLLHIEADLEYFGSSFSSLSEETYAPQVLLLFGSAVYVGAGVGVYFVDSEFSEDPFFILRAGLDLELLPRLHLDVNANYQTTDFDEFGDDLDTDTVTLGAAVRMEL